jgi:hypothetical protein
MTDAVQRAPMCLTPTSSIIAVVYQCGASVRVQERFYISLTAVPRHETSSTTGPPGDHSSGN